MLRKCRIGIKNIERLRGERKRDFNGKYKEKWLRKRDRSSIEKWF
jgi:hypothetical protein